MNTKSLVALSLLVGIGAVLHAVIPGVFLGMKPDMMLTMMFLGIFYFQTKKCTAARNHYRNYFRPDNTVSGRFHP